MRRCVIVAVAALMATTLVSGKSWAAAQPRLTAAVEKACRAWYNETGLPTKLGIASADATIASALKVGNYQRAFTTAQQAGAIVGTLLNHRLLPYAPEELHWKAWLQDIGKSMADWMVWTTGVAVGVNNTKVLTDIRTETVKARVQIKAIDAFFARIAR